MSVEDYFTCCNIQVKQHYCTMLATATGNCAVTNVTYNENTYYVVTWTVYLESSMYLHRRQWLRQIVVMCHIACWFRSGAVLKSDQFYHPSFSQPSLDLFPRKCKYAKVIVIYATWSCETLGSLQIDTASPPPNWPVSVTEGKPK